MTKTYISEGLSVETLDDELKITQLWDTEKPKEKKAILEELVIIIFSLLGLGFGIFVVALVIFNAFKILHGLIGTLVFFGILLTFIVIITIYTFYFKVAKKFNATIITINAHHLTIKFSPLPWPGNKQLDVLDLKQLYSYKKLYLAGDDDHSPLYVITTNLISHKLLDKLSYQDIQNLVNTIETFLSNQNIKITPYAQRKSTTVNGITINLTDNTLQLVSQWRNKQTLDNNGIFLLGAFFFTIGPLYLGIDLLRDITNWSEDIIRVVMKWVMILINLGLGIFSIIWGYFFLVEFFNKSKILIDTDTIKVINGPFSYIDNKQFKLSEVKQFYSKKSNGSSIYGHKIGYEFYLITQDNAHHKLFTLFYLGQALYLEEIIEQFLGLTSEFVPGQLSTDNFENSNVLFTAWQELAKTHNFEFSQVMDRASLTGFYRGHNLILETVRTKKIDIYTCFKLSKHQASITTKSLSSEYLTALFSPDITVSKLGGQFQVKEQGQTLIYTQENIITEHDYLQDLFDKSCDLLDAFPNIIAMGGQAVTNLLAIADKTNHPLNAIATYLLIEIAQDTTQRLSHKVAQLICSDCLHYCTAHPIQLKALNKVYYYGCRNCEQSQDFLEITGSTTAVLDNKMTSELETEEDSLRVNWLARRTLFDFNIVQIINATDKDVEYLAVVIGNDTDPIRQSKYKKINCYISSECQLLENTMRILNNTFGQVKIQ